MIGVIYRREFLDYLKSAKFLIGFGLALAISAVSTVINVQNFAQRQQDYLAAQRDLPGNKFDVAIYRPPQVLSVLVQGKDRVLGTKASVNYLLFPDRLSGYMSEGSGAKPRALSGFGSVDFAFLVRVFLSLLVIFLAYDAVAEEKVSGTLKLALSNALPRSHLLLGKCLAGLARSLARLSPVALFQFAAEDIAAAGLHREEAFGEDVRSFSRIFDAYVLKKTGKLIGQSNWTFSSSVKLGGKTIDLRSPEPETYQGDMSDFPKFVEHAPRLGDGLKNAFGDIAGLLAWNILLALLAFAVFLRADVR